MKHKLFLLALLVPLVVSCVKEDDFDALKGKSIIAEGTFYPSYSAPLANGAFSVEWMLKKIHPKNHFSVLVDSNSHYVTFFYNDTVFSTLDLRDQETKKTPARKEGMGDSVDLAIIPIGNESRIELMEKLARYGVDSIGADGLTFSTDLYLKILSAQGVPASKASKIRVFFDSTRLDVTCTDGLRRMEVACVAPELTLQDLLEGRKMSYIDEQDLSHLVSRVPTKIKFSSRMVLRANIYDLAETKNGFSDFNISLDSARVTYMPQIKIPVQFYAKRMVYTDTLALTTRKIDSVLNLIRNYASVKDSSKIVLCVANSLPVQLTINAKLLDKDKNPLTDHLFVSDSTIPAAPIRRAGNLDSYVSAGSSVWQLLSMPISDDLLKKFGDLQYVALSIGLKTPAAAGSRPVVCVRSTDQLDVLSRIVLYTKLNLSTQSSNK